MNRTASGGEPAADVVETPSVSVIIPAFNEAGYIRETLDWLGAAEQHLEAIARASVQILVVDNASTDSTAELAQGAGATVVYEAEHNIARVRNAGSGNRPARRPGLPRRGYAGPARTVAQDRPNDDRSSLRWRLWTRCINPGASCYGLT
jgi:GT2 family glycosyltransferase